MVSSTDSAWRKKKVMLWHRVYHTYQSAQVLGIYRFWRDPDSGHGRPQVIVANKRLLPSTPPTTFTLRDIAWCWHYFVWSISSAGGIAGNLFHFLSQNVDQYNTTLIKSLILSAFLYSLKKQTLCVLELSCFGWICDDVVNREWRAAARFVV